MRPSKNGLSPRDLYWKYSQREPKLLVLLVYKVIQYRDHSSNSYNQLCMTTRSHMCNKMIQTIDVLRRLWIETTEALSLPCSISTLKLFAIFIWWWHNCGRFFKFDQLLLHKFSVDIFLKADFLYEYIQSIGLTYLVSSCNRRSYFKFVG